MTTTQMKRLIDRVGREKVKIAKARDNLREMYDELSNLVECFDAGEEGIDNAIRELTDAVDRISEVV